MADDAFALSPLSARPAMPSQADYDAICEAFMETSRGRWFLTEYAKRNRNADTHSVLDAVSRIEQMIASQGAQSEPSASAPADDPRLDDWEKLIGIVADELDAIARAIAEQPPAPRAAMAGRNDPPQGALAAIRHAGQMVQGVAWTLRESGADGRICALLDQQAQAIAENHGALAGASVEPPAPSGARDSESAVAKQARDAFLAEIGERIAALIGRIGQARGEVIELDDTPIAMPQGRAPSAEMAGASEPDARAVSPDIDADETFEIDDIAIDAAMAALIKPERLHAAPAPQAPPPQAPGPLAPALAQVAIQPDPAPPPAPQACAAEIAQTSERQDAVADAIDQVAEIGAAPMAEIDAEPSIAAAMASPQEAVRTPETGPVTLGDVLTGEGIAPAPPPLPTDPFAPFARMTRYERMAYFS